MVKVCDAIMGSGKTSAAINYINEHPEKRFIYITPYLPEAGRIKNSCPEARFVEPSDKIKEFGFSKSEHCLHLMDEGCNIATTHQALKFFKQESFQKMKERGYTVIIDEELEALSQEKEATYGNMKTMLDAGYVEIVDENKFVLTGVPCIGDWQATTCRMLESRPLLYLPSKDRKDPSQKEEAWYWIFPPDMFRIVDEVIIMTYMFDRSQMASYFKMFGIECQKIGVRYDGARYEFEEDPDKWYVPEYVERIHDLLHVCDEDKLNAIGDKSTAMSMNWFSKNADGVKDLGNNIYSFLTRRVVCKASERMCAKYKSAWGKLRRKGFWGSGVEFNVRAKNDYRDKCALAYPANVYYPPCLVKFYRDNGAPLDEEGYALNTMIQWIWRSAIRDGHEVWLYLPSKRMRELLFGWMEEVSAQGS